MTSNDFHNTITNFYILYDVNDEDYIPFKVHVNDVNNDNIPNLMDSTNNYAAKIRWNNMTEKDINKYCMLTDKYLHETHVPTEVIGCKNINCSDENHTHGVNEIYISSLLHAGEQITQKNYTHKLGWGECVDDVGERWHT